MQSGAPRAGLAGILAAALLYGGGLTALEGADAWISSRASAAAPPITPAAPASSPSPAPPSPTPPAPVQALSLVIHLDEPPDPPTAGALDVALFWPEPGQVALPDGESARALEALLTLELDEQTAGRPEALAALLSAAAAEGVVIQGGSPERPWEALIELEIARRGAASVRRPDTREALALAQAIAGRREGTLAGDVAELYAIQALADPRALTYDPALAADAALNLLTFTDDFAVMEAATELLSATPALPALDPADRALLSGVYRELETPRIRQGLARLLLTQAPISDDPVLNALLLDDLAPPDDPALRGWRAALAAAAWRCQLTGPPLARSLSALARWDGVWRWSGWSEEAPLAACLEGESAGAPGPDAPARVRVELLTPGSSAVE